MTSKPYMLIVYAPCRHRGLRGLWHRLRGDVEHPLGMWEHDPMGKVHLRWTKDGRLEIDA